MYNIDCCALIFIFILLFPYCRQSHDEVARKGYMTGFIVNGIDVPISMYPHVVGITISDRIYCGGTIIGKQMVLTAAHCLVHPVSSVSLTPSMINVLAGSSFAIGGKKYEVCNISPHPKYVASDIVYDIGLIFLKRSFHFGPRIQPVSIAPNHRWRNPKYKFTVTGYGATTTKGYIFADRLQATRLSYVDSKTCNRSQTNFKGSLALPKHMFCLIGHGWSGDCYSDSGSGILWKKYLVGVVSHGRDLYCASDVTPSMYTDVVYFKKWIKHASKKLERKSCVMDVQKMSHVGINYYYSSEEE